MVNDNIRKNLQCVVKQVGNVNLINRSIPVGTN